MAGDRPVLGTCSFPPFSQLPFELRLLIWQAALPPVNGLILHPLIKPAWERRWCEVGDADYIERGLQQSYLIVEFKAEKLHDVRYEVPPLFHVNREANAAVRDWMRAQGLVWNTQHNRTLTRKTNFFRRHFDPRRDVLYLPDDMCDKVIWGPNSLMFCGLLDNHDVNSPAVPHAPPIDLRVEVTRLAFSEEFLRGKTAARTVPQTLAYFYRVEEFFFVCNRSAAMRAYTERQPEEGRDSCCRVPSADDIRRWRVRSMAREDGFTMCNDGAGGDVWRLVPKDEAFGRGDMRMVLEGFLDSVAMWYENPESELKFHPVLAVEDE